MHTRNRALVAEWKTQTHTAEEVEGVEAGIMGFGGVGRSVEQRSGVETGVTPGSGRPNVYFISS
jgi:lactate dehydrogenase-like 2-hydroxyacid dehydrogenase